MVAYSLVAILSVVVGPPVASSGGGRQVAASHPADVPSPTVAVRTSADALRKTLVRRYPSWSPQAEAQESAVQSVIDGIVDFGEIARRSLGRQWDPLTDGERREFVQLLQRIIERSPLDKSLHLDPDSTIKYEREEIADSEAVVSSVITTATRRGGATRHPVQYRLVLKAGHWRIYDIVVNEVSLVDGYHAQFTKIIGRDRFDGLLRRMRKKLGEMPSLGAN
jgi:phospholipid transport system substrate-binding protein